MGLLSNRKGVDKLVVIIILVVVLLILIPGNLKLFDFAKENVVDLGKLQICEPKIELCKGDFGCITKDYLDGKCSEEEYKEYKKWVAYFQQCNDPELNKEKKDSLKCDGNVHKEINSLETTESESLHYNKGEISLVDKITNDEVKKLAQDYEYILEEFAQDYDIEMEKLKTILLVESSGNPFSSEGPYPTVRFECVRYNLNVEPKEQVGCDTSKYKYGSPEHTNLAAFLNALKINKEQAIMQTSFGVGQIMGFNYKRVGYNSLESFYNDMFGAHNQIRVFTKFLVTDPIILRELKSENTNWAVIAEKYNGKDYKTNNYDILLANQYEALKESQIS